MHCEAVGVLVSNRKHFLRLSFLLLYIVIFILPFLTGLLTWPKTECTYSRDWGSLLFLPLIKWGPQSHAYSVGFQFLWPTTSIYWAWHSGSMGIRQKVNVEPLLDLLKQPNTQQLLTIYTCMQLQTSPFTLHTTTCQHDIHFTRPTKTWTALKCGTVGASYICAYAYNVFSSVFTCMCEVCSRVSEALLLALLTVSSNLRQ